MTKKQKQMRNRILIAAVLFAALLILSHTGLPGVGLGVDEQFAVQLLWFALYLVPYIVIGGDIVKKAVVNIGHGQVFDENFLMCIATFGAFGIGEYSEAVAVMLFYQVGELFQNYAMNRSRQSIADQMDICPEYANVEIGERVEKMDPDNVDRAAEYRICPWRETVCSPSRGVRCSQYVGGCICRRGGGGARDYH